MAHPLIEKGCIPLDKSLHIRFGVKDLIDGYDDTVNFLKKKDKMSDDLKALYQASLDWKAGRTVDVGESATLYRFLKFASWKLKKKKEFTLRGSLQGRKISDDPRIVDYSLEELLKLDGGTSQWASAAVLLAKREELEGLEDQYRKMGKQNFKLKHTFEAVAYWYNQRDIGLSWETQYDRTILRHAKTYLALYYGGRADFYPTHSEDYCPARAFDIVTAKEGESRWPQLREHESDRIDEMEKWIGESDRGNDVYSKDHRVVYSISMRQRRRGMSLEQVKKIIKYPSAVNKSWPEFWDFLEHT